MDWKYFATTFLAIFLAEFGDKTQLAIFSFAAGSGSRATVFAAAAMALIASTAVAVVAADAVGRVVPAIWVRRIAGALFIILGAVFLFGSEEV